MDTSFIPMAQHNSETKDTIIVIAFIASLCLFLFGIKVFTDPNYYSKMENKPAVEKKLQDNNKEVKEENVAH